MNQKAKTTLLRNYYYFLGLATLVLIVAFFFIDDAQTLVVFANSYPGVFTGIIALFTLWTVLSLVTTTILLFSSEKREKMFLLITNAEAKDELEEKAVNESVKSVFFLNIVLFVLAVALSSIGRHEITKKNGEVFTSFAYNIPLRPTEKKETLKQVFDKINGETGLKPKGFVEKNSMRVEFSESLKEELSLLPKRFFSVYGLMCFILLQFLSFRIFLFFHRRSIFS